MTPASRRLAAASAIAVLLVPNLALAQDDAQTSPRPSVAASQGRGAVKGAVKLNVQASSFCTKISDVSTGINNEALNRFDQLQSNFSQRSANIDKHFSDTAQKIADARAKDDTQRQQRFTDLDGKATTDAQKQAIATFEAAIKAAVTTRRAAVDAADAAFQKGVRDAVNQRQTQLKTASANYKTAVAAAVTQAQASCAAGVKPETVRQTLKAALATARQNLEAARKAADKVGPNLDTLKATRKAAIAKAEADFKAAVEAALKALKAALGASNASPSPSASPSA